MVKRAGGALLQHIVIDPASGRTIAVQLASGLRSLILGGSLRPGTRLPASRTLAKDLAIARSTVVSAFEQLEAEGLLEMRVGAGSFVTTTLENERSAGLAQQRQPHVAPPPERLARLMDAARGQFVRRLPHEPRAFTTALPAFDAFPIAQWSRIMAKHWRGDRAAVLGYENPHGHAPLRQAIAQHLGANRGVACDWRQVFVFAGAQQAFTLIASLLVDPGDPVWFEEPGAIGARNCFLAQGARLVPVPVDQNGLRVEDGLGTAPDFRLAFVTPAHQQPLGVKLAPERRQALLQAASRAGAWVVEDDWDGDFCLAGRPQPALKSADHADRVIYVGTFSKSLFPSLRLGYVVAPHALVRTFEMALEGFSSGVPTSVQAAVAEFMAQGHFATHVRRMRKLYAERHDALVEAAREQLAPWLSIQPTTIGLHAVGSLTDGIDAVEIADAAERRGLTIVPVSRFRMDRGTGSQALVLGFAGVPPARIRAGVRTLAEILERRP